MFRMGQRLDMIIAQYLSRCRSDRGSIEGVVAIMNGITKYYKVNVSMTSSRYTIGHLRSYKEGRVK